MGYDLVSVDERVDTLGVVGQYPLRFRMEILYDEPGGMRKIERAEEAVEGNGRRTEDFRQSPLPRASQHIHLPEPVLRVNVTGSEHEIVLVGCAKVRHAVAVAHDIDRLVQSNDAKCPLDLRERFLDEMAEEEKSSDEADNEKETQSGDCGGRPWHAVRSSV
jgi:hypothetical protein